MIESVFREIRYSLRALLRDKGFAATVILTLAFCLAANTATFAIVNSVLLRPPSVPESDQIVVMANRYPNAGVPDSNQSSSGDYFDRLRAITALQEQAMFRMVDETLYHDETAEQVTGLFGNAIVFPTPPNCAGAGTGFHGNGSGTGQRSRNHSERCAVARAVWRRPARRWTYCTNWRAAVHCGRRYAARISLSKSRCPFPDSTGVLS